MRRTLASFVILLLSGVTLAPAAMAGFAPEQRLCCMRGAHHCSAMTGAANEGEELGNVNYLRAHNDCRCCPLKATVTPASLQRPVITFAPRDPHPYLTEFYLSSPQAPAQRKPADRGPPSQ